MASAQLSGIPNLLYVPIFEPVASLFGAAYPLALLAALVTVVLRYRHAGVRERQQLKWVVWFGAVVIGLSLLVGLLPDTVIRSEFGASIAALLRVVSFILWQSFAAVAFGIAILRHKLWDIDVIIRKTLVYTALTALLALVYFGSVVLLQRLFGALTGVAQSPLAVVVSTLAIAALFTPLRRRIQDAIDRRFFRKKYDAQRVLAQFALTARDETDLDALTGGAGAGGAGDAAAGAGERVAAEALKQGRFGNDIMHDAVMTEYQSSHGRVAHIRSREPAAL